MTQERELGFKTKKIRPARYAGSEPDITTTGVGKNYDGYRMFYDIKEDKIKYIGNDYATRDPSASELMIFKMDLQIAARTNPNVARCLELYPKLRLDEPMVEGPAMLPPQTEPEGLPANKDGGG